MIGWQNLSDERNRTLQLESVRDAVQLIYPKAWEIQEHDDLAFYVGFEQPRLVAVAWKSSHDSWCYAIMNEISFAIGVGCAIEYRDGKNRIIAKGIVKPSSPQVVAPQVVAPQVVETPALAAHAEARQRASRVPREVKRRVFQENGQWYARVETRTHLKVIGPYASRIEANTRADLIKL